VRMGVNDHAWSAQTYLQRWGALQDGENWGQEPHAVRTPARTKVSLFADIPLIYHNC